MRVDVLQVLPTISESPVPSVAGEGSLSRVSSVPGPSLIPQTVSLSLPVDSAAPPHLGSAGPRPGSRGDVRLPSSGSIHTAESSLTSIDEGADWAHQMFAAQDGDLSKAAQVAGSRMFDDSTESRQATDSHQASDGLECCNPELVPSMREPQDGLAGEHADEAHADSYCGTAAPDWSATVCIPNAVSAQDCVSGYHTESNPGELFPEHLSLIHI